MPQASERVLRLVEQRRMLHERFDPVLLEPIPARLHLRRPAWLDYARAASVLAAGIAIGLAMPYAWQGTLRRPACAQPRSPRRCPRGPRAPTWSTPSRCATRWRWTPRQQDHLVAWLSKRLGTKLKVPVLAPEGFDLLGGRLLPGPEGPVAQFMYQEATGKRLTLYVSARAKSEGQTAFRFAQEGDVSVFYWIDGNWGYALSGEIDKPALSRVSTIVYRQLNP